jgi:ribosomal protein L16 Arg81 hydroxylase
MSILEELIHPLSLQEFSETYLFKMPYAAPFNARQFENLISWQMMDEIMNSGHCNCWLPQNGFLPEDSALSQGTLSSAQGRSEFQKGRTLLVRHAEEAHPSLKRIADDFHKIFKDPIDIQIYCTPSEQEGFNWHYDAEEVFVIQSFGEKEFRLRQNTIHPKPSPLNMEKDLHFEREIPSPEIRCHLKAGDWLYIPSGWWHKARAITESRHLSVGVMARTPLDYLKSLLPLLAQNSFWRQRLPLQEDSSVNQEKLRALAANLLNEFCHSDRFRQFTDRIGHEAHSKAPSASANDDCDRPKEPPTARPLDPPPGKPVLFRG